MAIPFTPVVYEHAARFVGRTPWEVSRDETLMFEGHRRAYLEYRQEVVTVGIDIYNLEAEAYGATVDPCEEDAIPAIGAPLWNALDEGLDLPAFDPACDGRVPMLLRVGRRLKREFPEADVRIPVSGPFSITFNLLGISSLCEEVFLRPDVTAAVLMRLAENQAALCRAVTEAGLGIAFFESAAAPPMLSPRQFRDVELPALKRVLQIAAEACGRPVPCIMGGDTFPIVDDLLSTGTGYLVINVETDQAAFVERVARTHPHVRLRVNIDPAVLAVDDAEPIYRAVDRALAVIGGRPNCVLGTGAVPLEARPENIRRIREYLANR